MPSDRSEPVTFQRLIDSGVLEIGDGYRAKNSELTGDGLIFLRAGHLTDTYIDFSGAERFDAHLAGALRPKIARPGDTIITTKGNSTGRTGFVTRDMPEFVYSPHLSYWRSLDENRIVSGFLRYWSRSREFLAQLHGMKGSTDMAPYLSLRDQRMLRITLPTAAEQRRIASILGALDDKIELNRRMNRTLEEMAQAIFKSWFVDFDGQTEFENSGTEIGQIPTGWDVGPLSSLSALRTDSVQPSSVPKQLWEHYSIPAFDAEEHPSKELGETIRSGKYRVPPTSILASKLNPRFPRIWMPAVEDSEHAVCSTEFMPFVPHQANWRFFVYELLRSAHVQNVIQSRATGTTSSRQRVRPATTAEMEVLIPPPESIEAFTAVVGPLYERRLLNMAQSRTLAELRDTLLPKLISGEIRVPEAESSVESAL